MGDQPSVFPRVRIGAALVAGTLLAGMLLAAPAANAEPPSAGSPDVEVGAAADLTSKPYAPGSIQIDASELTLNAPIWPSMTCCVACLSATEVSSAKAPITDTSSTTTKAISLKR